MIAALPRGGTGMSKLTKTLADNWIWWVVPIVLFLVVVAWFAWKSSQAPSEAFDYRYN
jgi:ABC-type transporter Mla subunit MlaD